MVSYDEIKAEINTEWGLAPGQANPTIYNRNIRFSTLYVDRLYVKAYKPMPLKVISQSNNGGLVLRKQFFDLNGIYATYTLAKTAIQELKRIVTEKDAWYVANEEFEVFETDKRYTFIMPCFERQSLQKGDW